MRLWIGLFSAVTILASCGGGDRAPAPHGLTILDGQRQVIAPQAVNASFTHSCGGVVENGSDAQAACYEAARKACPQGTKPKQVIFAPDSETSFRVQGYGCSS